MAAIANSDRGNSAHSAPKDALDRRLGAAGVLLVPRRNRPAYIAAALSVVRERHPAETITEHRN